MSGNPQIDSQLLALCDALDEARRIMRELARPELNDADLCLNLTVDEVRRARIKIRIAFAETRGKK